MEPISKQQAFCEGGTGFEAVNLIHTVPARFHKGLFVLGVTMETHDEQCATCSGYGYIWQQDPAGREDAEPLQAQCESCYGTGSQTKGADE